MKRRSNCSAMVTGVMIVGTGMMGCEFNGGAAEGPRTTAGGVRQASVDERGGRTYGTMAESFTASSSMAFPTGDRDTSAVLVEKSLPREVLVGETFEYQIRVTNLTDYPLQNIRIREFNQSQPMDGGQVRGEPLPATRTFGRPAEPLDHGMTRHEWDRDADGRLRNDGAMAAPDRPAEPGAYEPQDRMPPPDAAPQGRLLDEQRDDRADPGPGPEELGDEGAALPRDRRPLAPEDERVFGIAEEGMAQPDEPTRPQDRPLGAGPRGLDVGAGGDSAEYTIDYLGPGESRVVTATAVAREPGIVQLCSTVDYNPVLCSTTTVIAPNLAIEKHGPEVASACDPVTYTIVVTNTGVGPAEGVTIEEVLPEGLTAEGAAGGPLTLDAGTLAAGESREFTITARAQRPGEYVSRTIARSARGLTAEAEATTRLIMPELQVEKVGPERAYTGVGLDFAILVRNVGDIPVRNIVVQDAAPPGSTLVRASDNGQFANGQTTWRLDTLAPGEERRLMVRLEGAQAGRFENCVRVMTDCGQPAQDCATVTLEAVTGLRLMVIDHADPIAVGDDELYTVTVTNQGRAEATNVQVSISLPGEMQVISARTPRGAGAAPQPGEEPNVFTFEPIPVLGPGQSVEWQIVARGMQPADARFGARMTADQLTRPVVAHESTRIFDPTPAQPRLDRPPAEPAPGAEPQPGQPPQGPAPRPGEPVDEPAPPTDDLGEPMDEPAPPEEVPPR